MRQNRFMLTAVLLFAAFSFCGCTDHHAEKNPGQSLTAEADKLAVLWTSGDPAVAHKVCFMYTHNAKKAGWWNEVHLIVWGPSSKLLAEDKGLQTAVKAMMADGVEVLACKACSDRLGVSAELEALGVNVFYVGVALTEMLKEGWTTLTY